MTITQTVVEIERPMSVPIPQAKIILPAPSVEAPASKAGAKQLSLVALFEKHGAQGKKGLRCE